MSGVLNALVAGDRGLRLDPDSLSHTNIGGTAVVGIRIDSDGQVYTREGGGSYTAQYNWLPTGGTAANYEMRWVTGGTTPDTTPAASGTWVQCNVDRTIEESESGNDLGYTFTLELGLNGQSTALRSVTIDFTVVSAP